MDPNKYKSIAVNISTYKKLNKMAQERFEMPISMSKTIEFFIEKGFEEFSKNANRKTT